MKWLLVFYLVTQTGIERNPQDPYPTHESCEYALTRLARSTTYDGFYRCEPEEEHR